MKTSVIIPTLDRPEHLSDLLTDLFSGTRVPDEVLIVEQGDQERTERVASRFQGKGAMLHVLFQKEKSAPIARNTGAKAGTGDVFVFFDDDMVIGERYLEQATEYLEMHPAVLGVTGSYMKGEPAWTLKRLLGVFFCVYSFRSQNIVLSSGANDYLRGKNLLQTQSVEWLYGGNMVLRRSVFDQGFTFNPHFKRWGFGEDLMLTYQIHKKFPGSLWFLSSLEVAHKEATTNKILNTQALRMKILYRYIFWKHEVADGSIKRLLAYVWSQVGLSGFDILQYPSLATVKTLSSTYAYLLRHHEAISREEIDYNQFILSSV